MMFNQWLEETRQLQAKSFGVDPSTLRGAAWADYVMMNVTAVVAELGEMLQEIPGWKPWAAERGTSDVNELSRATGELIDVMHFIANLLVALGCDDGELSIRYRAKMDVNRARQAGENGYDPRANKCRLCAREMVKGACPVHGWPVDVVIDDA